MPKLTFLGTTGYHPNDRRQTTCLLLPELGVVFDAGTGIYRLPKYLQTAEIDLFLTHGHLDHVLGLTFFFDIQFQTNLKATRVHGEAAKVEALRQHLFSSLIFPVMPPIEMHRLKEKYELADGARLRHFPLEHPGGSVGYRIDWGDRSFAFVTDTTAKPDAGYLPEIEGVDLLVHECYFPDGQEELAETTGHSCTSAVAEVAKAGGVGKLILVHMNPMDESDDPIGIAAAREIFPATDYAEDGMTLEW